MNVDTYRKSQKTWGLEDDLEILTGILEGIKRPWI